MLLAFEQSEVYRNDSISHHVKHEKSTLILKLFTTIGFLFKEILNKVNIRKVRRMYRAVGPKR